MQHKPGLLALMGGDEIRLRSDLCQELLELLELTLRVVYLSEWPQAVFAEEADRALVG